MSLPRSKSAPDVVLPTEGCCGPYRDVLCTHQPDQREEDVTSNGYQVFKICRERCQRLLVTIHRGKGITRGRLKDWLYSPDPYVSVRVIGTPNGQKRTRHVASTSDPEWAETLVFHIDPHRDRLIEFVLYDLNRTVNEEIGREIVDVYGFKKNTDHDIVVAYRNGSMIEITVRVELSPELDLRLGLSLCPEESDFRSRRRATVFKAMRDLLGEEKGPANQQESPTVCLMTSGGGFRAMIAYAGAFKALTEMGIIDCCTYVASLSGSSWYLSTLYSHPDFPFKQDVAANIMNEIKACVEKHWQVHLSPPWSSRYLKKIIGKSVGGQPVSFTDFYGYLVGQQLLKGRMKARLSDQQEKINAGQAPMPLYTCLHVKSNVSAKVFQEWYEFTPYEVGIPKYGVFLKTTDFASKFYLGHKVKSFPEVPLHFLYGIWGSAFTILFKRLIQEKGRNGENEIVKLTLGHATSATDTTAKEKEISNVIAAEEEEDLIVSCIASELDRTRKTNSGMSNQDYLYGEEIVFSEQVKSDSEEDDFAAVQVRNTDFAEARQESEDYSLHLEAIGKNASVNARSKSVDIPTGSDSTVERRKPSESGDSVSPPTTDSAAVSPGDSDVFGVHSSDDGLEDKGPEEDSAAANASSTSKGLTLRKSLRRKLKKCGLPMINNASRKTNLTAESSNVLEVPALHKNDKTSPTPSDGMAALEEERSRWDKVLERALTTTPLDSRAFRAGVILNPLRGLTAVLNGGGKNSNSSDESEATSHLPLSMTSPVKPTDRYDCDFKGYRESMKTDDKKIYLVDSGLSFNLPFPLVLRPQRGIQLYITMDFSSRKSDSTPPFRELLLAEKWARLHRLPFPPVREIVKARNELDRAAPKECYVFSDPEGDPHVPVILFFPLVNVAFKDFVAPGMPRQTAEEKEFGAFSLFDDTTAYAIWRFVYPGLSFDRLTQMVAFNLKNNERTIKEEIASAVERTRHWRQKNADCSLHETPH